MTLYRFLGTLLLSSAPTMVLAQNSSSLQNLFKGILILINSTLIPFLFGIAFLVFTWNVIRYFVIGAGNEEARESAKSVATYSVGAFVFLIIFFGLVRMLTLSTGLDGEKPVCPDYLDPQHCINYIPVP